MTDKKGNDSLVTTSFIVAFAFPPCCYVQLLFTGKPDSFATFVIHSNAELGDSLREELFNVVVTRVHTVVCVCLHSLSLEYKVSFLWQLLEKKIKILKINKDKHKLLMGAQKYLHKQNKLRKYRLFTPDVYELKKPIGH